MPEKRIESSFDENITSERVALRTILDGDLDFPEPRMVGKATIRNPHSEKKLGK